MFACIELAANFKDVSTCEAAECSIAEIDRSFLMAFANEVWDKFTAIHHKKDSGEETHLPIVRDEKEISKFFRSSLPKFFSLEEKRPPRDSQTLLSNSERFRRTGKIERDGRRQVYVEIDSGRFFYVDNLHYGPLAQLEVFASDERHLGIASIANGTLDATKRKADRIIHW